jgi:5-methylcytosine-specific restriction endonuclease McrA
MNSRRTPMPSWLRQAVLEAYSSVCQYCGRQANSVDHLVPVARGGSKGASYRASPSG